MSSLGSEPDKAACLQTSRMGGVYVALGRSFDNSREPVLIADQVDGYIGKDLVAVGSPWARKSRASPHSVWSSRGFRRWTATGDKELISMEPVSKSWSPDHLPVRGEFEGGVMKFIEGTQWARQTKPSFDLVDAKEGSTVAVGGFYKDPNHYKAGTFAGLRMIADD